MEKSVSPRRAVDLILSVPPTPVETESVPIIDLPGRVLSQNIYATIPLPPFDRSPYDGYAFIGEDTFGASRDNPVTLKIIEEIPAGYVPMVSLEKGQAAKILTGAPIPSGADSTVMYEMTDFTEDSVRIYDYFPAGSNIIRAGDEIPKDTLIMEKGSVITPEILGPLGSIGLAEATVYKKPAVGILNTGTELVNGGEPLPYGKIYSSSVYILAGFLRNLGLDGYNAGVVADDPQIIAQTMEKHLENTDVLITTGGGGGGDYDFSLAAAKALGAKPLFRNTMIKPGGGMTVSRYKNKVILSLSGNPGAALMALLVIGSPFLKRLCGRRDIMPEMIQARVNEHLPRFHGEGTRLFKGSLQITKGVAYFSFAEDRGTSPFGPVIGEIPAESGPLEPGSLINAYII